MPAGSDTIDMRTSSPTRLIAALHALIVGPLVGAAGAQSTHAPEAPGRFLARPAVSIDSIRYHCLELGDDTYGRDVPRVGACVLGAVASRGTAGGRRWYSTTVQRRWLLADSGKANTDTVVESELVLFAAAPRPSRDTLLTPVWHYRFEPEILASVTPEIAAANDGVLVAIDECVNGTGGCSQSFLLEHAGRWRMARLAFVDSLNRLYPNAILHGYHVDAHTLRASAAVYGASDANCCPSRVAEMRLRLRDGALEIVELHVRPTR